MLAYIQILNPNLEQLPCKAIPATPAGACAPSSPRPGRAGATSCAAPLPPPWPVPPGAAAAQSNLVPATAAIEHPRAAEHSKGLGQPVATDGYGKPSKYEANVQRRPSPA